MANARFEVLSLAVTSPEGLPKSVDFVTAISSESGLLGWFDFSQSANITQSSGVSAVTPRAGSGGLSLAQATAANQPTYDATNGRLVFDSASTQYMQGVGNWPTTDVGIAIILQRSATNTTTEGIIGSTSPSTGSHSMYFQANGELRFRVTDGTNSTFEEPAAPTPPNDANVLILADYSQTTDQARCRFGAGAAGTSVVTLSDITMNTTWNLGALTDAGGSPCSMEVSDLIIFDKAIVATSIAQTLVEYAAAFKSVS